MTLETRLQALEQSLDRAQSSLRRTRFALGALALAALAGLVMAAARDNGVLSAREFVVVDAQGHALARLGSSPGGGGLALLGRDGHLALELAEFGDGPALHLNNGKGHPEAVLFGTKAGPALTFRGTDGHVRLGVGVLNNDPNLSVLNDSGAVVWKTH